MSGAPWNYSDESRFESRDEAGDADARLDNSTCAECGEELEAGLRGLCSLCRVFIDGLENDDDE